MPKIKTKIAFFGLTLALFLIANVIFLARSQAATEYTLENLDSIETWQINQDINDKRSQITELERQIETYRKNISAKQNQISSLSGQVSTLNDGIAKVNLEVKAIELEIEETNLKIQNAELKIQAKQKEIDEQKKIIGEILRKLYLQEQKSSVLEILILNDTFSDFIADLERLQDMQTNLLGQVDELKQVKIALEDNKSEIVQNKTDLGTLKDVLDAKIGELDGQKAQKNYLISVTQGQEEKFQQLLDQAKEEFEQAEAAIVYLEKIAREKLNRELSKQELTSDGFMWPISSRRITAYFHDPDYPYRNIFEHNAVDIATPQGTAISAADSGYVAIAKDGGAKGYSYIMIVHASGFSTVYGHVNQISVEKDQFVSKGQIIGYSGGLPGTRGAGPFSTGAHLHFEVRIDGVPVNPLNYLP